MSAAHENNMLCLSKWQLAIMIGVGTPIVIVLAHWYLKKRKITKSYVLEFLKCRRKFSNETATLGNLNEKGTILKYIKDCNEADGINISTRLRKWKSLTTDNTRNSVNDLSVSHLARTISLSGQKYKLPIAKNDKKQSSFKISSSMFPSENEMHMLNKEIQTDISMLSFEKIHHIAVFEIFLEMIRRQNTQIQYKNLKRICSDSNLHDLNFRKHYSISSLIYNTFENNKKHGRKYSNEQPAPDSNYMEQNSSRLSEKYSFSSEFFNPNKLKSKKLSEKYNKASDTKKNLSQPPKYQYFFSQIEREKNSPATYQVNNQKDFNSIEYCQIDYFNSHINTNKKVVTNLENYESAHRYADRELPELTFNTKEGTNTKSETILGNQESAHQYADRELPELSFNTKEGTNTKSERILGNRESAHADRELPELSFSTEERTNTKSETILENHESAHRYADRELPELSFNTKEGTYTKSETILGNHESAHQYADGELPKLSLLKEPKNSEDKEMAFIASKCSIKKAEFLVQKNSFHNFKSRKKKPKLHKICLPSWRRKKLANTKNKNREHPE